MSRADQSRARRAAFHYRRAMSRSGTARLEAARNFLRAELAHADPVTAERAATQAADALLAVARGLNGAGVRDDAA